MLDLTTKYLGLTLRNPVIIGSSGLTDSAAKVKELEENGAAAVVLKSLFEEEITMEYESILQEAEERGMHDENLDYFDVKIKQENLDKYLQLIRSCKEQVFIPVIASINCVSSQEWTYFAKKIEDAGADALELNVFILPTDSDRNCLEKEQVYFDIVEKVRKELSIPVALKISPYFSNLSQMIERLSKSGIGGLVLFNRFYSPDFDINEFKITSANVLSNPEDLHLSLRWVAMMAGKKQCDLVASTGIHNGQAIVKQLLAGATAVQVVSSLYRNGTFHIQTLLDEVERWMTKHGFEKLSDFRGKMSQKQSKQPAVYERMQFMKHFGGYQA